MTTTSQLRRDYYVCFTRPNMTGREACKVTATLAVYSGPHTALQALRSVARMRKADAERPDPTRCHWEVRSARSVERFENEPTGIADSDAKLFRSFVRAGAIVNCDRCAHWARRLDAFGATVCHNCAATTAGERSVRRQLADFGCTIQDLNDEVDEAAAHGVDSHTYGLNMLAAATAELDRLSDIEDNGRRLRAFARARRALEAARFVLELVDAEASL